jgi:hypothetical protein
MLENKTGVFDAGHLKGWILKKGFSWLHAFRILPFGATHPSSLNG